MSQQKKNTLAIVFIAISVFLLLATAGLVYWNLSQREALNELVEQMTIEKAELEDMEAIQAKRKRLWNLYHEFLSNTDATSPSAFGFSLPDIPSYATNNAHMFYLVCRNLEERTALIKRLKEHGAQAVFHYLSLHSSPFYAPKHDGRALPECDRYADCLVRLPMYYDLTEEDVREICGIILSH